MAKEVIVRLLEKGVGEFVVCAGARNAALVEVVAGLAERGVVRMWRHFEERSAGFFAMGRTMATGRSCAVVTTSGTAVAELLPAVVEARYRRGRWWSSVPTAPGDSAAAGHRRRSNRPGCSARRSRGLMTLRKGKRLMC